jgi:uncharacterized protein (DUF1778 family)
MMKDQKRELTMNDQYLTYEEMLEIADQREKENEQLHLSPQEQKRFAEMLLNSPGPREKLKQAMRSYFKNVALEDE